jgi:hypothetical protein
MAAGGLDAQYEAYVARNPCVLDRAAAAVDRYPLLTAVGVTAIFAVCFWSVWVLLVHMQLRRDAFLALSAWVALDLATYWSLALRDPGFVAPSEPACASASAAASSSAEYCVLCRSARPPRAHHCRVCGRCVAKRDHHCAWIGTCVGERNERDFVLFCLHTALLGIVGLCISLFYYIGFDVPPRELYGPWLLFFNLCAFSAAAYGAGYVASRQLYLAARGLTGRELALLLEEGRAGQTQGGAQDPDDKPLSLRHALDNLELVLGAPRLLWLVPLVPVRKARSAPTSHVQ